MLTSVYEGRQDAPLVADLLKLHHPHASVIVDCNYGGGRFWQGQPVIGIDTDPARACHLRADNRVLPFKADTVDVLTYDPPHIPDSGPQRKKDMDGIYTIAWGSHDIMPIVIPFLFEAWRVLRRDGIILAKLSDQVERNQKRWQVRGFENLCGELGFTVCDRVIKVRPAAGRQPWGEEHQRHAWQRHSDFVIVRKGHC